MRGEGIRKPIAPLPEGEARHGVREQVARFRPPRGFGPFVRLHRARLAYWLLLLLGFAVQLVIIHAVGELIDLSLSLMELWAELARKHLELTL